MLTGHLVSGAHLRDLCLQLTAEDPTLKLNDIYPAGHDPRRKMNQPGEVPFRIFCPENCRVLTPFSIDLITGDTARCSIWPEDKFWDPRRWRIQSACLIKLSQTPFVERTIFLPRDHPVLLRYGHPVSENDKSGTCKVGEPMTASEAFRRCQQARRHDLYLTLNLSKVPRIYTY